MTINSVLPSLKLTGMAAISLGALTSARNHRGASDSLFASRKIDEASDGSPRPARTCRRFWRLATSASTALRLRRLSLHPRERRGDEILGQPHRALRFGAGSPACLKDDVAGVDR